MIAGLGAQQAAAAKAVATLHASEVAARAATNKKRQAAKQSSAASIDLVSAHAAAIPPSHPSPAPAPGLTAAPVSDRGLTDQPALQTVAETHDPCQLEADASDQWQRANLVLLNYVRALGTLAGTGTANTYGFDTLATGLTGSKALSSKQAEAFKSGAALIAADIFAARRREAIATYAVEADEVLKRWISALESVANENYRFALMQERRDVNHFFVDTFVTSRGDESALASLEYKTAWNDELTATDLHLTALNAYVKALEALRSAHHAMVVKITKSGFTDLSAIVDGYIAQVQPEIAKMHGNLATPAPTQKL
jgi:hypothetical protein